MKIDIGLSSGKIINRKLISSKKSGHFLISHLFKCPYKLNHASPLVSSWVKLLNYSYNLLEKNQFGFDAETGIILQEMANYFLPEEKRKQIKEKPEIRLLLSSFLTFNSPCRF